MELIQNVWNSLDQYVVAILAILGGFSVLAKLTPTDVDDKVLAKITSFIHMLGLTKKK